MYTGTRPGFPRHQGGEGLAGTPGAFLPPELDACLCGLIDRDMPATHSHLFSVRLFCTGFWTFLGVDFRKRSRIQRLLVQHWIHVYVSYGGFWYFSHFLRQGGPRIPVLCNAWFDSGYMLCVSFEVFWPMSLLCMLCRFSWVPSWRRQSSSDGCIRREISREGQLINALMS